MRHSDEELFVFQNEQSHMVLNLEQKPLLLEPPFPKTPQKPQAVYISDHYPEEEEESKSNSQKQKQKTKKKIKKEKDQKKGKKEYKKRVKDNSIQVAMGRPDNNGPEGQHLKENKSYNDIVYHFSRFLIFLKLNQGTVKQIHQMQLSQQQAYFISRAQQIMAQDNYPGYQDIKPNFLLHPNSPHYVLLYQKQHHKRLQYRSQEIQCILIAYLRKKGLLTTDNYRYLMDY